MTPIRLPLPNSHAAAYHASPDTVVAAVCDVVPSALEAYVALWGQVPTYTDYREMLRREQLDLVSIVTPDHLHADVFIAACEAGVRGIFCEKPLATTLDDADRMIAAAGRSGTKVVVNHTRRFDPFYRQAKWLIEQGAIGTLRRVLGTLGGDRAMLFRIGTHLIDTIAFFVDAPVSWVMAELDDADADYGVAYRGMGGRDPASDPGASAYLHFRNGVRAFYNGSKGTMANFEIDLQGELGRIRIGNHVAELSTLVGGGLVTQPLPLNADLRSGMVVAVDELIALIEGDRNGVEALEAARSSLEILVGILVSAATSRRVTLPLA